MLIVVRSQAGERAMTIIHVAIYMEIAADPDSTVATKFQIAPGIMDKPQFAFRRRWGPLLTRIRTTDHHALLCVPFLGNQ
jgi:hypothetical protein